MSEEKQGMSGCAIAAIVVGIIMVLGLIAFGTCTALVLRSPAGQVMTEGMSAMATANMKPGTNELRAAGCKEAMVLNFAKLAAVVEKLAADAGQDKDLDAMKSADAVICTEPPATMTCADVARIYLPHALPETTMFSVSITKANGEAVCNDVYDRAGNQIEAK